MVPDFGMELQNQLKTMDDMEQAFIHLGFEFTHMSSCAH